MCIGSDHVPGHVRVDRMWSPVAFVESSQDKSVQCKTRVIDTKNKYTTFGDEETKMDLDSVPPFETEPAGTTATRWDRWVKRFENYLVAKDIVDDVRKRAMLLNLAGGDIFDISETLDTDSDTYQQLKRKLTEFFAPKQNTEYEVYVFRQATQQPNDTLDRFVANLRRLAVNCEFHDKNREIKSQVIQRCTLQEVRDKGLRDQNITLRLAAARADRGIDKTTIDGHDDTFDVGRISACY